MPPQRTASELLPRMVDELYVFVSTARGFVNLAVISWQLFPNKQEKATVTVLEQAETLSELWVAAAA